MRGLSDGGRPSSSSAGAGSRAAEASSTVIRCPTGPPSAGSASPVAIVAFLPTGLTIGLGGALTLGFAWVGEGARCGRVWGLGADSYVINEEAEII
jgi:hypothetical protein